jgi:hypothetical protein
VDGGGNSDRDGWEYSVNPTWSGPFGPTRDRARQVAMGGQFISMPPPPPPHPHGSFVGMLANGIHRGA